MITNCILRVHYQRASTITSSIPRVLSPQGVQAAIYWAPQSQPDDFYSVSDRKQKNGAAGSVRATPMMEEYRRTTSCLMKFLLCLQGNEKYRRLMRGDRGELNKINSVSTIDRVSRILFPASFTVLNIVYWLVFTS